MAIFGDLSDIPFSDLLNLLSGLSGVLHIERPGQPQLALVLDRGVIQEVRNGGRSLDSLEALARVQELLKHQGGSFEFSPGAKRLGPALNWPVERLMLLAANVEEEIKAYAEALPDPRTRFVADEEPPVLEEPLASFLERALPYLKSGTSGEELARALRLPQDQVVYYLHKLRLLGVVKPQRVWRTTEEEALAKPLQGLFKRVLRVLFGGAG